jgi:AcrR family transcriptional regulator
MAKSKRESMRTLPTRSDRRMVRNREALLAATEMLIAQKGRERVTVDEITETADLAKGTFYNYFSDKNAIVHEAALVARADLESRVRSAQAGVNDPAQRLAIGICVFLRSAASDPIRVGVVAQMYGEWLHPEAEGNLGLRMDLEHGYCVGRFSGSSIPAAVVLTVGVVQAGIKQVFEMSDSNYAQSLASDLCSIVLRALGVRLNEAQAASAKAVTRVFVSAREAKENR